MLFQEKEAEMLAKFKEYQNKASIYYAYHTIQRYTDEPFTSYMPEVGYQSPISKSIQYIIIVFF